MASKKPRTWVGQICWRLLVVGVMTLPISLLAAPYGVTANAPESDVVPVMRIFVAWVGRNRVYRTANAYISAQNDYYDRLHAKALEQLRARELGGLRTSQVAAYVKAVALIEREREAMIQFAESEKRAARTEFIEQANNTVVNVMLSTSAATRVLGAMTDGVRSSKGMINRALDELGGGGSGALAEVQQVRETASWVGMAGEIVGGNVGSRIRAVANGVVDTIERPTAEIEAGLVQVLGDLDGLEASIEDLEARGRQPTASEVASDAVMIVATGEQSDPAAEAIVDLLAGKAGQNGGGFRDRARAALAGNVMARCAAIGTRYREVLFQLEMSVTDEEARDTIQVPSCSVVDLGALAREDEAVPAGPEVAQETPRDAEPPREMPATPQIAQATPPVAEPTPERPAAETLDPCAVMPPGGTLGLVNENTCFATFSAEPAGRTVQLGLLYPHAQPENVCQSIAQGSDYHTVIGEWPLGLCGYLIDANYKGQKVPGYTGWSIYFVLDRFTVIVGTNEEYPANKDWVVSTADEIEQNIRTYLSQGGD
jgi:flagellar basal body rod protein FlgC/cell division septation protein DedD